MIGSSFINVDIRFDFVVVFSTVPMRVAAPRRGTEFDLPGRGRRP